jgi:hypothetical protein
VTRAPVCATLRARREAEEAMRDNARLRDALGEPVRFGPWCAHVKRLPCGGCAFYAPPLFAELHSRASARPPRPSPRRWDASVTVARGGGLATCQYVLRGPTARADLRVGVRHHARFSK